MDDKVIATAQQIVRSLATDKTAAADMLRILSTFDNRFSAIHVINDDVIVNGGDGAFREIDEARLEIETKLEEADKVISNFDSSNSDCVLFESSPEEIGEYFLSVEDLIKIVNRDDLEFYSDLVEKAEILIQIAMARLEDEFRHLMIRNTVPLDAQGLPSWIHVSETQIGDFDALNESESLLVNQAGHWRQESSNLDERLERFTSISEDCQSKGLIRPEAVVDLRGVAELMIRSNYSKELCQVYSRVRREVLEECLSVLGVERTSIDEVQKIKWKILDGKMRKWIQAMKVVVKVLLAGERRLCDQIFSESEEIREECFVESTKGCLMLLLNFGDAVAIQKRASEKLFRILDMYEALSEVKYNLVELFVGDLGKNIIKEAERIMDWLGDAVRGTLVEFGNAVQKELSRKPMQGGEIHPLTRYVEIHPLTRYVMNYVKLLGDYSSLLESLLEDDGGENKVVVSSDDENTTRMGHRLRLLISYLESNLEDKSKVYEDAALQFIFLMNNRLYIVKKVKDSELVKILGENWVRQRRGQIRQYHNSYLRASWTKALSFLKDDGLSGSGSRVSKVAVKERFKNFNLASEEMYKTQSMWKVPDTQLREDLRLSTSEKVIPAYRSFLGRFGSRLETSRHAAKYIKYTPDDLDLMELFEGTTPLSNHPRRKNSLS